MPCPSPSLLERAFSALLGRTPARKSEAQVWHVPSRRRKYRVDADHGTAVVLYPSGDKLLLLLAPPEGEITKQATRRAVASGRAEGARSRRAHVVPEQPQATRPRPARAPRPNNQPEFVPEFYRPGELNDPDQKHRWHFWSLHAGGANWLLADGSVRFLSYGVGKRILPALATYRAGEVVPE